MGRRSRLSKRRPVRGSDAGFNTRANPALLLRKRRESALRFLRDARVPFTNNQAEKDLPRMKLRMRISGTFRSEQGARDFATPRSVLSTAKQQRLHRIHVLMQGP
ncbi:MAG: transposase [Bryobacterales bacterium]|nr:transposase [Bryobacterales bacterium]